MLRQEACKILFFATFAVSLALAATDFGPHQPRYWPKYGGSRFVRLLDGTWKTGRLGSIERPPPESFDSMDPGFHPSNPIAVTPNSTQIPSCLDNAPPGYLGYRGVSFFRTTFDYDLTKAPARLQFQACSFYCRIWVNGVEVGDHRSGGYVAFSLDVSLQDGQAASIQHRSDIRSQLNRSNAAITNELFVLVDNRFNATRAPTHTHGDYWQYSGIMRSVELHAMPRHAETVWPWRLYALPTSLADVNLTLHLSNSRFSGQVKGRLAFDDGAFRSFQGTAKNGVLGLGIIEVPNPRVWSLGDAQLHTITIDVNGATVTERFGLRIFGIDNKTSRITINGEIRKLVGWSHHMQWPESAASPTDAELDDDLALMREAGTLYVRGAHYPNDPRWLDRLDEAGMVMWCETLGAGVSSKNTVDTFFMKYQTQQLNEMLDNAMNHASIMLWAFFNEGPSDDKDSCEAYETCARIIRERDQSRLVTYASNRIQRDVCLHAADVISFNNYPGWYGKADPTDFWNEQANNIRNGTYPDSLGKPFLISETGAGGIYEFSHNKTAKKWTLGYQNKVISEDVDVAIANNNISGVTLWHFMDFKTDDNTENNSHCVYVPRRYPPICSYINTTGRRPGGLNHKGVVDFWRRKKPAYDIVAMKYNATNRNDRINQPRYWPKYLGERVVRLLDGTWETGRLGSIDVPPSNFDSMDPNLDPSDEVARTPNKTFVPSCIDNVPPGHLGYRRVTFFRTFFEYNLTYAPARILFQACSFYCRVWVNGVDIGDHRAGGYVAFFLDVPMQADSNDSSGNELVVLVDNRFNSSTAPMHTKGDYWQYSGIMRSVELHALPPPTNTGNPETVWPWRLYALPQSLSSVKLSLHLTSQQFSGIVHGSFNFDTSSLKKFSAIAKDGVAELGIFEVPKPRVWTIENPHLHTIQVNISGAILFERFGLRQFGIEEESNRITLNGRIVKFVGWNHHMQWPETSASPTDDQMDKDIALLQQAGTIYVRGSHYPQDPRWLDRLDEKGILMWSETLGAGVSTENATNDVFMTYQKQQIHEMMDNALNHASIMLWAFFNEGPSKEEEACAGYEACAKWIKAKDTTRLVTFATDALEKDKCLHAGDVVSFNSYPGWYQPDRDPATFWITHANNIKAGAYPGTLGKPFLISETGAAGIYEWSQNKSADMWTLGFQSNIIAKDVDAAITNPNISGITLWHFMDFKTHDDTENNTHCDYIPDIYPPVCSYINASKGVWRPGGLNHKGVVDFWRRKKPVYDIVAAKYNASNGFIQNGTHATD